MLRFPACLALILTVACAPLEGDDSLEATLAGDETATAELELAGGSDVHRLGVVSITIPGDPQVRTGLLVSPTLVMASKRWFPPGTVATNLVIRHGVGSNAPARPGWTLTVNAFMPMAFIQVVQPFANVPALTYTTRSPVQLLFTSMTCFGYESATAFGSAVQTIGRVEGDREISGSRGMDGSIEDHDAGAPCFDFNGALIGFILSTPGGVAQFRVLIFDIFDTRWYVDNMLRVASLRAASGPTLGYTIETTVVNNARMCMDVFQGNPYSGVAVFAAPCTGITNQRWFIETRAPGAWAFVNAQTGTCLDVPGGTTAINAQLLARTCSGGTNQSFAWLWHGTLTALSAGLDYSFNPARAFLCLVPEGAPSSLQATRLAQVRCSNRTTPHEAWSFQG